VADYVNEAIRNLSHIRVLSMDGGGIYGAFTAIMLQKLCEATPSFLKGDQVTLFAGTSAGAINALILAKHENPREAIERRTLEHFWKDARVYSNRLNPIAGALSLVGLTSWSGKADFYAVLEDYFGDMKMKDLKHRVLITAFDLWGTRDAASTRQQRWKPKIFYNFPADEPDRELYVKDVAYGAASPPTLRPVLNGISDGGIFADDPSVNAIAKIVSRTRAHTDPLLRCYERICTIFLAARGAGGPLANLLAPEECRKAAELLSELQRRARERDGTSEQDLARELDAKRADLLDANYAQMVKETTGALDLVASLLDLWGMRPQTAKGSYQPQASRPKLEADDWSRIKAFVDSVVRLVGWEIEFWRLLGKVLDASSLPQAIKTDQVSRPGRILTSLEMVNAAAKAVVAKAEYGIDEVELILLRLGLLRNTLYDQLEPPAAEDSLKQIAVLSLGVGAMTPHYFARSFDFGFLLFNLMSTNLRHKFIESPLVTFALNPDKQETKYEAKQLLGEEDYFRLDPPVIGFPVPSVLTACYLARIPFWRELFLSQIYKVAESQSVGEQIDQAQTWIEDHGWAA